MELNEVNLHEADEAVGWCMSKERWWGSGYLTDVMCEGVNGNNIKCFKVMLSDP